MDQSPMNSTPCGIHWDSDDFGNTRHSAHATSACSRKHLGEYLSPISTMNVQEIQKEVKPFGPETHGHHVSSSSNPLSLIHTCRSKGGSFKIEATKNYGRNEIKIHGGQFRCEGCLIPGGKFNANALTNSYKNPKLSLQYSLRSWFKSIKKKGTPASSILCTCQVVHDSAIKSKSNTHSEIISSHKGEATSRHKDDEQIDLDLPLSSVDEEAVYGTEREHRDVAIAEIFKLKRVVQEMESKLEQMENKYKLQYTSAALQSKNRNGSTNNRFNISVEDAALSNGLVGSIYDQVPWINISSDSWSGTLLKPTEEEFCNAMVEARIGVKQMCRALMQDQAGLHKLDALLQDLQVDHVNINSRVGSVKAVKYHLESLFNQVFYEDFENTEFRKSGSSQIHCILDPRQRSLAFYRTYTSLLQVGWEELLIYRGESSSNAYSESFDEFCNEKMNKIADKVLHWEIGEWPDELAKSFFIAARWIWMLHLLAFSFQYPATIFRVGTESHFDPRYMEVLPYTRDQHGKFWLNHQHHHCAASEHHDSVKILAMVMPGFFLMNYKIIRCKVMICSSD